MKLKNARHIAGVRLCVGCGACPVFIFPERTSSLAMCIRRHSGLSSTGMRAAIARMPQGRPVLEWPMCIQPAAQMDLIAA